MGVHTITTVIYLKILDSYRNEWFTHKLADGLCESQTS